MLQENLDDLLCLFAAVIVSDKRVFAEEIQTMLKETSKIQSAVNVESELSEAKVLLWYEMNKASVIEKLSSHEFETWFYRCLNGLDHIEDKQAVLDVMLKISLADGELHESESGLIALTARHWKLDAVRH